MLTRFFRVPAAALVAVVSTILLASTTSQQWTAPISASLAGSGTSGQGSSASTAPQPGLDLGSAGTKGGASFAFLDPTSASANPTPILLYAQDWNGFPAKRSMAAWEQAALTHQVLVGTQGAVYGKMIAQLHVWNPKLKVLVYDLGPYTIKGTSDYNTLLAQHPNYFAHDKNGHLITVKAASGTAAFPKNTLMDQGNAGWQQFQAQRILKNIQAWGFDGAYVDSMGPGVFTGTTTGVPVDPRTGKAYTDASWMQAGAAAMNAVKAAIGKSKYLMATGLVNGSEYTSFTHYLADSNVDGMQTELVAAGRQRSAQQLAVRQLACRRPRDGAVAQREGQGILRVDQGLDQRLKRTAGGVEHLRARRLSAGRQRRQRLLPVQLTVQLGPDDDLLSQ